jgi:hypothetical protein
LGQVRGSLPSSGINKTWEDEFLEGKKLDEAVEILGYDVVALYPSLKLEFMIREIDRDMVLRIETMKAEEEKRKETELRNITMSLVIFMLEHQLILADLTLLMGEIDMLDRLKTQGIFLSTYNRYVDDITAMGDVKEKNKMENCSGY